MSAVTLYLSCLCYFGFLCAFYEIVLFVKLLFLYRVYEQRK